ncbi:MAG TPA: hypothetical protein DIW17_06905 [Clostridiales bacterium]|nr:hypothetical protein [Clostridiales bacterium]
MTVVRVVCDILEKRYQNISINDDEFISGISQYTKDNHLEMLMTVNETNNENIALVESFIEPLLELPEEFIVPYFVYYDEIKEVKKLSGIIFDIAYDVYKQRSMPDKIDEYEKRFMKLAACLYNCDGIRTMVEATISETIMDLDFAKGKTDKFSMRLSRRVSVGKCPAE